ncbi:hypothetical protein FISHEDRAFT_43973, partial [Fistulina hepatica ATCC 64428]
RRRGRTAGIANYSSGDKDALLDIAEAILPIGQHDWQTVACHFNTWADENARPQRLAKSLEAKFKSWVRTPKPTGDGECPPEIERAHQIEYLINGRADTRDLEDEVIELSRYVCVTG